MSLMVSCLMPSFREPAIVERAIRCFQEQTYGPKELIILRSDNGLNDLFLPKYQVGLFSGVGIHFVPPGLSIGELRNVACRLARGSVLAHWDDDDVSHPDRLARSMNAIDEGDDMVGSSRVIYTDGDKRWLFDGSALTPTYLVGGSLVFRRKLWEKYGFDDVQMGEDSRFFWKVNANGYGVRDLADESLYLATISPDATSKKDTSGPGWTRMCYARPKLHQRP